VDHKGCALKVSDGNENSVGNWTTGYLCYGLEKKFSTFFHALRPCEAEFKSEGIAYLAEEISR
jgi:hypothetical protein